MNGIGRKFWNFARLLNSMSHVQHFLKTDYTEYSVRPNIRFEPNIRPNNRFSRIFVKTDYSAEYSDKTEYSVEPNIRFQKI
jgi:hypothetical protein